MTSLVLTLIGQDRAGLVARVADVVEAHGGNWESSSLAELSGTFAGVVQVSAPPSQIRALSEDLERIEGLSVIVRAAEQQPEAVAGARFSLQVLGDDRPGIVREVSSALLRGGASIESMSTQTREAAMSGGRLFATAATVRVPEGVAVADVARELEGIAAEIQVDIAPADETAPAPLG
jgi:glycine cleavage system regulatory protein